MSLAAIGRSVAAILVPGLAGILLAGQSQPVAPAANGPFSVVEATIPQMQAAMEQHRASSREIVQQYLTRIAIYEDRLNAVITVNPKALEEADARDRERAQGRVRGPLHGIPIGRPVAWSRAISFLRITSGGGWPALQTSISPEEDARPQTSVA